MAPTSEERREVAARLRELDHEITSYDTIESGANKLEKAVYGNTSFSPIEYSVRNLCGLANTLADLIDPQERTCHPKGDWKPVSQTQKARRLVCDCGYELGVDRKDAAPFDLSIMCELPNFCPNCGARLVGE